MCWVSRFGQETKKGRNKRPKLMTVKSEEASDSSMDSMAFLMGLTKDMIHADVDAVGAQGYKSMQARRRKRDGDATAARAEAAKAKPGKTKPGKIKAKAKLGRKKATFRRGVLVRRRIKKGAKKEAAKPAETDHKFQSYDLLELEVPLEAWPQGPAKGQHSYTLRKGQAVIEVLLRNRAFYCKKIHPFVKGDANHTVGQVGWKTSGGIEAAWRAAKERMGCDLV